MKLPREHRHRDYRTPGKFYFRLTFDLAGRRQVRLVEGEFAADAIEILRNRSPKATNIQHQPLKRQKD